MEVEQKKPLGTGYIEGCISGMLWFAGSLTCHCSIFAHQDVTLEDLEGNAGVLKDDTEPGHR